MKRGVISSPPQHLLEWHHHSGAEESDNSRYWVRTKASPDFHPPRLFPPYFSEAKVVFFALYVCYSISILMFVFTNLTAPMAEW